MPVLNCVCEDCGREISEAEWGSFTCSWCDWEMTGKNPARKPGSDFMECTQCSNPIRVGAVTCSNCQEFYSVRFWSEYRSKAEKDQRDPWYDLTPQHRLCCDQLEKDCRCGKDYMEFDEIYRLSNESYGRLYASEPGVEEETKCILCKFYYSEGCIPLRVMLRAILSSDEDKLDDLAFCSVSGPCGHFLTSEEYLDFKGKASDREEYRYQELSYGSFGMHDGGW